MRLFGPVVTGLSSVVRARTRSSSRLSKSLIARRSLCRSSHLLSPQSPTQRFSSECLTIETWASLQIFWGSLYLYW
ncbi:hypothetical protein SDJN02_03003, partial [Cucurbita argyrosperma subsp. argyrosperma]